MSIFKLMPHPGFLGHYKSITTMHTFADILPVMRRSIPILLTYAVPEHLAARLRPGSQVLIPLGTRTAAGYIVALHDNPPAVENIKAIEALLDAPLAFTERELELARWMAAYYCCPLASALRPFLSDTGAVKIRRKLQLTPAGVAQLAETSSTLPFDQQAALRHINEKKSAASPRSIAAMLGAHRAQAALHALKDKGLVEETATLLATARAKPVQFVSLAADDAAIRAEILRVAPRAPRQADVLEHLMNASDTAPELRMEELGNAAAVQALARRGLVSIRSAAYWRTPWQDADIEHPPAPTLNAAQQASTDLIVRAVKDRIHETFLLFGVTGSGKTEIFLLATIEALAAGRQALLLVPEISLTAQVVGLLRSRFGDTVAVLHSALSAGERADEKERIRQGLANVIVGPRSAIFAPFADLGLVVVDEEHDASYKQEHEPHYHGRDVAIKLAEQFGCPCVLASATPALESFYLAKRGDYQLLQLYERPEGRPLPSVHLLDLRGKSRRPKLLLPELLDALAKCLEAQGQAIVFLNRRGHSTFMFCPMCGQSFRCPHCQVGLIYHIQQRLLRCHHCDYATPAPDTCPNCHGAILTFAGFGTQRIVEELQQIFPSARIARMDKDTTSHKGAHLHYISDFRAAAIDILVGTQMISKGLHFPGVTVVGVVAADISLNMPDFRAAERTFQLLTQVAGRAGRGDDPGSVYIQTYNPEHFAILAAKDHDFESFYARELWLREEACYPPFCYLANIITAAPAAEAALDRCEEIAEMIRAAAGEEDLEVLGPAPAPLSKLRDQFRFHILLRSPRPGIIQRVLGGLQDKLSAHGKVQVSVDVDPVNLM
jgi:primosomal protein N' (replication factor Y) (superfamily II helicase)